jgi:putative FmdB family regulatory protein
MPLYDFRCADCAAEREAMVGLDRADSLELVCFACGGTMTRALPATVAILVAAGTGASPPPAVRRRRHTCTDEAVALTRPNPFADALPSAVDGGEGHRR